MHKKTDLVKLDETIMTYLHGSGLVLIAGSVHRKIQAWYSPTVLSAYSDQTRRKAQKLANSD